jgi:hypothetical protein
MVKLAISILFVFFFVPSYSQDLLRTGDIDRFVEIIDNEISDNVNIREYIRPMFADDGGGIFLKHRYVIDTAKKVLLKAIRDFVDYEQIALYYKDRKLVKAVVTGKSTKKSPYQIEYYFKSDSLLSIREVDGDRLDSKWDKQTIISASSQYLQDFLGICELLKQGK